MPRYATVAVLLLACAEDTLSRISTLTDQFVQSAAAEVDVLWVIDNSESMAQEQLTLGSSFQAFATTLAESQVDYRIGVVSTDPADGGKLSIRSGSAIIDRDTFGAESKFLANVRVGTGGARAEEAFASAALALGVGGQWKPGEAVVPPNHDFLRQDASLFIIMVSDEDDKSFGPVRYYERLFQAYKGVGNEARVSVSAIVGPPPGGLCGDTAAGEAGGCSEPSRGNAARGDRYLDLAARTGGVYTCICEDFVESLRQLSITAAGLQSGFGPLSGVPNRGASVRGCDGASEGICVRVDGEVVTEDFGRGWIYDDARNMIVFGAAAIPKPQAVVTVEYLRAG